MRYILKITVGLGVSALLMGLPMASALAEEFSIPAQSAASALNAYAEQTKISIVYNYNDLSSYQTNAVAGEYDREEALELLLNGTGLTISREGETIAVGLVNPRSEPVESINSNKTEEPGNRPLMLEEVIVTVQKRAENINDIGITVNAVQGEILEQYKIFGFAELEQVTAGLALDPMNIQAARISLRGVSYDINSNAAPAVEVYWNDVRVATQVAFEQMFDIDRIEVQKGPQGTLQGRSAPGGNIMIVTRRPDLDGEGFSGEVMQTFSDNSGYNTQLSMGVPLVPGTLAARVAAVIDESDDQGIRNSVTGNEQSNRTKAGRLSLAWAPTDNFDASLILQATDLEVDSFDDVAGSGAFGVIDKYDRTAISAGDNRTINRSRLASLTLNWDIGEHRLTSLTGYMDRDTDDWRDFDAANQTPGITRQSVVTDEDSITQELRLSSLDNDFWEYMLGLYYLKRDHETIFERDVINNLFSTIVAIPIEEEEFSIFTHHTFHHTDRLRSQFGLRYQEVDKFNRSDVFLGDDVLGLLGGAPRGTFLQPLISAAGVNRKSEEVTGSMKVLYDVTPDSLVYAAYERGFRPGGVIIDPLPLSEDLLLFEDETSDSIELGIKSTLMNGRLQLNTALYRQQFDGHFVTLFNTASIYGNVGVITYNADATITGIDLEANAIVTDRLRAGLSLNYTDTEFDNGAQVPCTGPAIPPGQEVAFCDAGGGRIGDAPDWSVTSNGEYVVAAGGLDWFMRGLVKYTGGKVNSNFGDIGGYTTFNLYSGVRDAARTWEVSLWAKNLFDKEALYVAPIPEGASGYSRVDIIQQRTVGITGRYNFSL